jgi:hypothetical protein
MNYYENSRPVSGMDKAERQGGIATSSLDGGAIEHFFGQFVDAVAARVCEKWSADQTDPAKAGAISATSPEYYTRKEFGEKFRVCPATVQNWCNDGTIEFVRIGGRVLIPASQFEGLEDGEKLSATKIRRAQRRRRYGL